MQPKFLTEIVTPFLALESTEECLWLLDALFTPTELDQLPIRWELLVSQIDTPLSQRRLSKNQTVAMATAARAQKAFHKHEAFLRILIRRIQDRSLMRVEPGSVASLSSLPQGTLDRVS